MAKHPNFQLSSQNPRKKSRWRLLPFLIIGMLLLVGLAGCADAKYSEDIGASSVDHVEILEPSPTKNPPTPIPSTATFTATSIPSATPTPIPPTQTSTPLPSIAPRTFIPSPTPLPQPMIIGYSVAERPLEVYHFGNGPIKRMIIAGIHGGYEWNTIALADQLIDYLTKEPEFIPDEITLYILRSANPDGVARVKGSAGRANDNGVDINRNFPVNWAADWDRQGCWNQLPITAGTRPMSEPETGAIMQFVLSNRIETLISYHSAALGIFAGGQPPTSKSHDLAETLASVAPYTYPPPYDSGCEYTGQLTDWAAVHNIAAVDIELTNHEDTDFYINLAILAAFLSWEDK